MILTLSIIYAMVIMVIGFAIFQFLPNQLLMIFNASEQMLEIGNYALRIISLSFLFAGFCIISSSVFQALSHGFLSLAVSVVRQLVVLLPAAFILSKAGGLHAVWWSFPIAELFSLAMCLLFVRHVYKKEIHPMKQRQE